MLGSFPLYAKLLRKIKGTYTDIRTLFFELLAGELTDKKAVDTFNGSDLFAFGHTSLALHLHNDHELLIGVLCVFGFSAVP